MDADFLPLLHEAWSLAEVAHDPAMATGDDNASSDSDVDAAPPHPPPPVHGTQSDLPPVHPDVEQEPSADQPPPQELPAEHAAESAHRSRQVRPETFDFGKFRMTFKAPNSWQALCRYHAVHEKTKCTKAATVGAGTSTEDVLKRLKLWCLSANAHATRQEHMGPRGLPQFSAEDLGKHDDELAALEAAMPPLP